MTNVIRKQARQLGMGFKKIGRVGVITGLGKYGLGKGEFSQNDSAVGAVLRSLGSHFGGDLVGELGSKAGNWLSKVIGLGAYEVENNTILAGLHGSQVPVMHSTSDSVVVRHREYVGQVLSSVDFVNQSFAINPGNRKLFPWLCTLASNYRMWKMHGALFEFKSTASMLANTANTGSVMMTTNYNVYDPPFESTMQVLNNTFTTNAKPYETFVHPLECAAHLEPTKWCYIRNHAAPTGQDQRLYDMGMFQIATEGVPVDGAAIGQLWVTYEVELAKPIMYGSIGADVALYAATYSGTTTASTTTTLNLPQLTGNGYTVESNDFDIYTSGGGPIFPAGNYGVYRYTVCVSAQADLTNITYVPTADTNFELISTYPSTSVPYAVGAFTTRDGASTKGTFNCVFRIVNPSEATTLPQVAFTVNTAGKTYAVNIYIEQVSYNLWQVAQGKPVVGMNKKFQVPARRRNYVETTLAQVPVPSSLYSQHEEKYQQPDDDEPKEVVVDPTIGLVNCPRPSANPILRAIGLSKSTLDIPSLKKQ